MAQPDGGLQSNTYIAIAWLVSVFSVACNSPEEKIITLMIDSRCEQTYLAHGG